MTTSDQLPGSSRRAAKLRAIIRSVPGTGTAKAASEVLGQIEASGGAMSRPDISSVSSWKVAALRFVSYHEKSSTCFSAGEIARDIRVARPDLRFGVAALTRFVGRLTVLYDGHPAVIVERRTDGSSRSPSGRTVEVYAPSVEMAMGYDFEVEIPAPGMRRLAAGPGQ